MMIKLIRTLALCLAGFLMAPAVQAEVAPDVLAKTTTNEVMRIVRLDPAIKSGDTSKTYALVEAKILPHFNFEHMTKLAVARNWNKASSDQQSALIEQFKTLLVRTYASSLSSVVDYQVEFKPLRMQPGETDVVVNTEVSKPGAPPIPIDYRLERTDRGWKVYDVMVDNVSLVTVYRNSFNSEVRRGGIDGLIATLVRRNQGGSASN